MSYFVRYCFIRPVNGKFHVLDDRCRVDLQHETKAGGGMVSSLYCSPPHINTFPNLHVREEFLNRKFKLWQK
jgi:hypothetical protein